MFFDSVHISGTPPGRIGLSMAAVPSLRSASWLFSSDYYLVCSSFPFV